MSFFAAALHEAEHPELAHDSVSFLEGAEAQAGFELDVGFQAGEEITVLFGPSGSGKSLTLQCIAGIRGELREELLALQRRAAATTVVATHDLEDAFLLGQRMAVINDGRVLQEGPREEIFYRPRSRRVAEFVRTRNVLRGTALSADAAALRIGWRGRVLEAASQCLAPDTPVDVCIRPTQIMIMRPDRPTTEPRQNVFHGCIVQESILAESYRLYLRLAPPEPVSSATGSEMAEHRSSADDGPAGYDLEIELPGYVYFRLGLDRRKEVTVSIRRDVVHVMPDEAS